MGDHTVSAELYSGALALTHLQACTKPIQRAAKEIAEKLGFSPAIRKWNAKYTAFCFSIEVDIPTRGPVGGIDIRTVEPIILVLSDKEGPEQAPSVYSDRLDFPVEDLPHLNLTDKSIPASLCLHRGNFADWFAEHTLSDVIDRVRGWYRDAASHRLIRSGDAFEPTRIATLAGICIFDDDEFCAAIFANWKESESKGGYGFLDCEIVRESKIFGVQEGDCAIRCGRVLTLAQARKAIESISSSRVEDRPKRAMGIIIWTDEKPRAKYLGSLPQKFEALEHILLNLDVPINNALREFTESGFQVIKGIPIVLAVSRPGPVLGTTNSIELLTFVVRADSENRVEGRISPEACVVTLGHRRPLTAAFARNLSRESTDVMAENLLLIGAGAIGSKLALHLGRAGWPKMTVVDADTVSPHNLARHALLADALGNNKSQAVTDALNHVMVADDSTNYIGNSDNIQKHLTDPSFLQAHTILIDATASNAVLQTLVRASMPRKLRVIRCEIAHEGRLGIMSVEGGNRHPRLDDLHAALYDLAIECEEIAHWLHASRPNETGFRAAIHEEIGIGVSCSSDTMRLADDNVSIHAAAFSLGIRELAKQHDSSGILQISHFATAPSRGWTKTYKFPESMEITSHGAARWLLRISGNAILELKQRVILAGRSETGGLLIGFANRKTGIIFVTRILPPSSDSIGTPWMFKRGVKDYPAELEGIEWRTGRLLGYVGEWHTHPDGDLRPSTTDRNTLAELSRRLAGTGLPAHILIASKQGFKSYTSEE